MKVKIEQISCGMCGKFTDVGEANDRIRTLEAECIRLVGAMKEVVSISSCANHDSIDWCSLCWDKKWHTGLGLVPTLKVFKEAITACPESLKLLESGRQS